MNRSPEDLGGIINTIQRDLDEMKAAQIESQAGVVPDNSVTTPKLVDSAVTAAKIANGAVTSDKIASGAVSSGKLATASVTKDKIDFTSFGCIESCFYFEDKAIASYVDVTTNKGTQLRIAFAPGTVPFILSGGDNIKMAEVITVATLSQNTTAQYGIEGVSNGAVIYCRRYSEYKNSSTSTTGEINTSPTWNTSIGGTTVYGGNFADIGSGTKNSFFAKYTIMTWGTGATSIHGSIGAGGSLSSLNFEAQVSARPSGTLPAIFQSGADSYFSHGAGMIRVYEAA